MSSQATSAEPANERIELGSPLRGSVRWLPLAFGFVLLVAVVVAALHFAEARELERIVEQAEPWWLALALLCQAGTYAAAGQVFRGVARAGGYPLSLATAYRLSLTKLFVDQAVPSAGLSGTVVLANGLQKQGMARSVVAAGVVVDLASYYAAYVLGLGIALVITAIRGEANAIIPARFVRVRRLRRRAQRGRPGAFREANVGDPEAPGLIAPASKRDRFHRARRPAARAKPGLLLQASACQLAIVLCGRGTVWVLIRSLGAHGSASGVFASFMISSILAEASGRSKLHRS